MEYTIIMFLLNNRKYIIIIVMIKVEIERRYQSESGCMFIGQQPAATVFVRAET